MANTLMNNVTILESLPGKEKYAQGIHLMMLKAEEEGYDDVHEILRLTWMKLVYGDKEVKR